MNKTTNKLTQFRIDIRKEKIASMMQKIRYEVLESNLKQQISDLIEIPQNQFTPQHLQQLIEYVNLDQTNAILHLGNLVIDRFVTADSLEQVQWKIGGNQYWTWLINALAEIKFCTHDMFEYLIWKISMKKSTFNLENALEALQRCLKANTQHTLTYFDHKEELLLALVNHVHDSNERVSSLSLGLIVSATSYSEDMPNQMFKVVGEARLSRCLLIALMKLSTQSRILAVQAANNFLLSGVLLVPVAIRMLQNACAQKDNVRLELSFYFNAFAQKLSQDQLLQFIRNHNLLIVLRGLAVQKTVGGRYGKQTRENAFKAMKTVTDRSTAQRQKLLMKEMYRLGVGQAIEHMVDQGDDLTMCQQIQ